MADVANLNSTHFYLHDWALSAIHDHSKILGVIVLEISCPTHPLVICVLAVCVERKSVDSRAVHFQNLSINTINIKEHFIAGVEPTPKISTCVDECWDARVKGRTATRGGSRVG